MTHESPHPFVVGGRYADRNGGYTVISIEGGRIVFEYDDGRRVSGDIETKARIHRNILLEQSARSPRPARSTQRSDGDLERRFHQDEVFPIIARIIERKSKNSKGFLTHDAIVQAMLEDSEAELIIADCQTHETRTPAWWAHNMLAWFSQRITVGESLWGDLFDREEIDGKWAYRSLSGTPKRGT